MTCSDFLNSSSSCLRSNKKMTVGMWKKRQELSRSAEALTSSYGIQSSCIYYTGLHYSHCTFLMSFYIHMCSLDKVFPPLVTYHIHLLHQPSSPLLIPASISTGAKKWEGVCGAKCILLLQLYLDKHLYKSILIILHHTQPYWPLKTIIPSPRKEIC